MMTLRFILLAICFLLSTLQTSHAKVELHPHTSLSHTPSPTSVDIATIKIPNEADLRQKSNEHVTRVFKRKRDTIEANHSSSTQLANVGVFATKVLHTQNKFIDEKVQPSKAQPSHESWLQSKRPKLRRSNSADNMLQDTYIRQGQQKLETTANAFLSVATEADTLSYKKYVELQQSRLPGELRDNPEMMAQIRTGYVVYTGIAKAWEGISLADDITGNVVSGCFHAIGEGIEWCGTKVRRLVRDDMCLGQRAGQNVGDLVEIFAPGAAAKGISVAAKIAAAAKFRSALGTKFGINYGLVWNSWEFYPKKLINGTSYAKIGNRLYTEHAIGRMLPSSLGRNAGVTKEGMSISPNFVEHVIRYGEQTNIIMPSGICRTKHSLGTVEVYTENHGKLVVTVNSLRGKS